MRLAYLKKEVIFSVYSMHNYDNKYGNQMLRVMSKLMGSSVTECTNAALEKERS
jgi:hypothetical protein